MARKMEENILTKMWTVCYNFNIMKTFETPLTLPKCCVKDPPVGNMSPPALQIQSQIHALYVNKL